MIELKICWCNFSSLVFTPFIRIQIRIDIYIFGILDTAHKNISGSEKLCQFVKKCIPVIS